MFNFFLTPSVQKLCKISSQKLSYRLPFVQGFPKKVKIQYTEVDLNLDLVE